MELCCKWQGGIGTPLGPLLSSLFPHPSIRHTSCPPPSHTPSLPHSLSVVVPSGPLKKYLVVITPRWLRGLEHGSSSQVPVNPAGLLHSPPGSMEKWTWGHWPSTLFRFSFFKQIQAKNRHGWSVAMDTVFMYSFMPITLFWIDMRRNISVRQCIYGTRQSSCLSICLFVNLSICLLCSCSQVRKWTND